MKRSVRPSVCPVDPPQQFAAGRMHRGQEISIDSCGLPAAAASQHGAQQQISHAMYQLSLWKMGRRCVCWPIWSICLSCSVLSCGLLHLVWLLCCQPAQSRRQENQARHTKLWLSLLFLFLQNYGCSGNLLYYHGVVERNRISSLQSHTLSAPQSSGPAGSAMA